MQGFPLGLLISGLALVVAGIVVWMNSDPVRSPSYKGVGMTMVLAGTAAIAFGVALELPWSKATGPEYGMLVVAVFGMLYSAQTAWLERPYFVPIIISSWALVAAVYFRLGKVEAKVKKTK